MLRSTVLIIAAALLAVSAPAARALDIKSYSGASCVAVSLGNDNGAPLSGFAEPEGFYVQNAHGWDVTCPIVRDNTTNIAGLADIELGFSNDHGTFSCTAVSSSPTGSVVLQVARSSTAFNGRLDWNAALNSSVNKGTYAIRCTVNSFSYIRSYYADEY
jgi:hypothetical protein